MATKSPARADLHCHSSASQLARLGVQTALGLPECATPPEEVYELAKARGMDFVTLTDHDTIAGALEIADRPDVFVSEELTAWFRGEPQAVHVLCLGITPEDHEWLQASARDLEACAGYLHERGIACALAHPFFAVAAPLTPRHRRRLAQLFPVWETRNGARARELNMPAAVYIETHGGVGVGGSDDHAGTDVGRTFTETPPAGSPIEFLRYVVDGHARARGDQGSAAKWAHSAMALAARVLPSGGYGPPDPAAVLTIVERIAAEGADRRGSLGPDVSPADARDMLEAWLDSVGLEARGSELIAHMQADGFRHADLARRARHAHESKLREAVETIVAGPHTGASLLEAGLGLFEACLPAVPYAPAAAVLGREKGRLVHRDAEPPRVAVVADALGGTHGVTRLLDRVREEGVPGYDVEVIATDANVDRRLAAVAEVEVPFYPGLRVGVPSLPAAVDALAEGRYDLVHLCSPGPAGLVAALVARIMDLPVIGSYHTELGAYAALRTGDPSLEAAAHAISAAFYARCERVLSPSHAADGSLRDMGIPPERIGRWERGVDLERFGPERRRRGLFPGEVNVLYAGRLSREKGVDLLADAFEAARAERPGLHLVLAGGGPEETGLRERLGDGATFLGWLRGHELARAYASADLFLFASRTDTFGQVILEAQASALPVVAVADGGPLSLVEDGRTGLLRPADPAALAGAVLELAASPDLRARLGQGARKSVEGRSWARALGQLAEGYGRVLGAREADRLRRAA